LFTPRMHLSAVGLFLLLNPFTLAHPCSLPQIATTLPRHESTRRHACRKSVA
jgi:hypothetical protein